MCRPAVSRQNSRTRPTLNSPHPSGRRSIQAVARLALFHSCRTTFPRHGCADANASRHSPCVLTRFSRPPQDVNANSAQASAPARAARGRARLAPSKKVQRGMKCSLGADVKASRTSESYPRADLLRALRKAQRRITTLEQEAIAAREQSAHESAQKDRTIAARDRTIEATRARFCKQQRSFRDHLNATCTLIPGTDGRTMEPDLEQVKQYGPDCHVCGLSGHWRDVCPHGRIYSSLAVSRLRRCRRAHGWSWLVRAGACVRLGGSRLRTRRT